MGMERVRDVETGDPGVIAAVVESGFDVGHPDLRRRIVRTVNTCGSDDDMASRHPVHADAQTDHGTHMLGLIAAEMNNGENGCGVAPGCRLMPVRIANAQDDERITLRIVSRERAECDLAIADAVLRRGPDGPVIDVEVRNGGLLDAVDVVLAVYRGEVGAASMRQIAHAAAHRIPGLGARTVRMERFEPPGDADSLQVLLDPRFQLSHRQRGGVRAVPRGPRARRDGVIPCKRMLAALRREPVDRVPRIEGIVRNDIASAVCRERIDVNWSVAPEGFPRQRGIELAEEQKKVNRILGKDNIQFSAFAPIFAHRTPPAADGSPVMIGDGMIRTRADFERRFRLPFPEDAFVENARAFIAHEENYCACSCVRLGIGAALLSMGIEAFSYAMADDADQSRIERFLAAHPEPRLPMLPTLRGQPVWAALRETIRRGRIGVPAFTHVRMAVRLKREQRPPWFLDARRSGGMFLDLLIHGLDQVEWLTGRRIVSLTASTGNLSAPADPNLRDHAAAYCGLDDATAAVVEGQRLLPETKASDYRATMAGNRGTVDPAADPPRLVATSADSADSETGPLPSPVPVVADWPAGGGVTERRASLRANRLAVLATFPASETPRFATQTPLTNAALTRMIAQVSWVRIDGDGRGAAEEAVKAGTMWKGGKHWVYSITYDEGCADLLRYALSLHRRYGIPGHAALVASQIGVARSVPGSSYNGMMILSREEIDDLRAEGWGVSCHGMTHAAITEENVRTELFESRTRLSDALGVPVTIFCLPGNNDHQPLVRARAAEAGYLANMTVYDRVNTFDGDLMALGRVPLHAEYPPPFHSVFDPYKRLHQAADMRGWIIDYCHCPMPGKAIHPRKDCTLEQLDERFATVLRVGGSDVWLAEPNEVVAWILHHREASL